ncbi:hypothetical protein J8273_6206 [Carpediemonas membranifera]|uniref:Uncharacterized protein n=1 Tax=Carpediemonas membranifera TaxID=201153 RepID=A0A8J6BVI4_9EUKA|nr:hypothetical protein J8273_6206 [Carpediemonas membranifera]|eukprot:KAG9391446.1 hypothetical protein J8273_6206 [Carpediemonas membranifera]
MAEPEDVRDKIAILCSQLHDKYSNEIRNAVKQVQKGNHPAITERLESLKAAHEKKIKESEEKKQRSSQEILDRYKVAREEALHRLQTAMYDAKRMLLSDVEFQRNMFAAELRKYGMTEELPKVPSPPFELLDEPAQHLKRAPEEEDEEMEEKPDDAEEDEKKEPEAAEEEEKVTEEEEEPEEQAEQADVVGDDAGNAEPTEPVEEAKAEEPAVDEDEPIE